MSKELQPFKMKDFKDNPAALWTFVIENVVQFLPESKRPNVSEIVEELKKISEVTVLANGEFKGCRIPPPFSNQQAEWMYNKWMPDEGDVLVATFPKTGTTWMHAIVTNLLYKGNEEYLKMSSKLSPFFTYLEGTLPQLQDVYKLLFKNRVIRDTHLPAYCVNLERLKKRGCKIICVIRNPKDQALSWYKFRLSLPFYDNGKLLKLHPVDWSKFLETHHTGQQWLFNKAGEWYPHHILSWYPYRNEENVRFVYYEDLKKDPFTNIKKIAQFLQVDRSDKEIEEVVEATSFQVMSKYASDVGLTRKGIVGDWKNQFTIAQSELIDQKFKDVMKDTDIRFTYEPAQ